MPSPVKEAKFDPVNINHSYMCIRVVYPVPIDHNRQLNSAKAIKERTNRMFAYLIVLLYPQGHSQLREPGLGQMEVIRQREAATCGIYHKMQHLCVFLPKALIVWWFYRLWPLQRVTRCSSPATPLPRRPRRRQPSPATQHHKRLRCTLRSSYRMRSSQECGTSRSGRTWTSGTFHCWRRLHRLVVYGLIPAISNTLAQIPGQFGCALATTPVTGYAGGTI